MKSLSFKDKAAYFAKVREANYVASLRLEGFSAPQTERKEQVSAGKALTGTGKRRTTK